MAFDFHPGRVALVLLGSFVAQALAVAHALPVSPPAADAALQCRIRAEDTGSALRLQAVVRAKVGLAGEYSLSVLKKSESGTSQNVQTGTFSLSKAQESVVTTIMLERAAVGHYRASLVVKSNRGSVSCNAP